MRAMTKLKADPSNTAQARAWDGDDGAYWAHNAEHFDRSMAALHVPFMAAANLTAHDHVLDIGCGTGQTTRDAARVASSGSALGVDLSLRMIDHARHVAAREGLVNVSFEHVDAQIHPFKDECFDVAFSRTGAMFFGDPIAAFTNIARALRRGGRLVLLTWQGLEGNEWIRELSTAMAAGRKLPIPQATGPGPFSLSDPQRVRTVLSAAGFTDIQLEPRSDAIWLGDDVDNAQQFVLGLLGWMLSGLDDQGRQLAIENLRTTLAVHDSGHGVLLGSATWTILANRHEQEVTTEGNINEPVCHHP